ncbi:DUF305 domain-containing protein [Deinococcus yunweiensis]|uniref:DUF305 domain-containing protein n=1 Tax=Deinococcus yunweiensis TaxID=367282 RepID=UPI00398E8357
MTHHRSTAQPGAQSNHTGAHRPYLRFGTMIALSFGAMYILMYAMVNVIGNVFNNINQVYMAGLMTAPMVIFELALMGRMYPNKRANVALLAASVLALVAFWGAIRTQSAVGDVQFVRSMIPHHSGAILMCEQASLRDAELVRLCDTIVQGQQAEITEMKAILQRLGSR